MRKHKNISQRQFCQLSDLAFYGGVFFSCLIFCFMWLHITLKMHPLADHWQSFVHHAPYFIIAFAGMCIALLGATKREISFSSYFFIALPILFLTVFSFEYGYKQFGGYDLSPMIDAAWRSTCGQVPYHDYIYTLPPSFYAGCVLAHAVFGVQWSSFIEIFWLYSLLSIILILLALGRARIHNLPIILLIVTGMFVPQLFTTHWWHSSVTSLACCVFLAWLLAFLENPRSLFNLLMLALAFAWLALSKPNGAFPCLALGGCIALIDRKARVSFIGVIPLGLLLTLGILLTLRISPTLLLKSYWGIAQNRMELNLLFPSDIPVWGQNLIRTYIYLFFPLVILSAGSGFFLLREKTSYPIGRYYLVAFAASLSAYMAMKTNWDFKHNDLPLLVFAVAIALFPIVETYKHKTGSPALLGLVAAISMFLAWSSFAPGASRWRQNMVGYGMFYEVTPFLIQTDHGYFSGLKAGPRFHAVRREALDLIKNSASKKIFFGPRIEFLYADLQMDSIRGLPLWWHPGSSYPISKEEKIVSNFKQAHIDQAVFLKDDYTRIPQAILTYLDQYYIKDNSTYPDLTVFRRKP